METAPQFDRLVQFLNYQGRSSAVVCAALKERPEVVAQALILAAIERGALPEAEAGRIVAQHKLRLADTLDALLRALAERGRLTHEDLVQAFALDAC